MPRQFLQEIYKKISRDLKLKKGHLHLVFLDPGPAKKLNFQFRQKNYATDVLSFEPLEPESLGELVMCPAVLKKQAREHGLSFQWELTYMLLHGILHLLGYDHEKSAAEAQRMFEIQDRLFEKYQKNR